MAGKVIFEEVSGDTGYGWDYERWGSMARWHADSRTASGTGAGVLEPSANGLMIGYPGFTPIGLPIQHPIEVDAVIDLPADGDIEWRKARSLYGHTLPRGYPQGISVIQMTPNFGQYPFLFCDGETIKLVHKIVRNSDGSYTTYKQSALTYYGAFSTSPVPPFTAGNYASIVNNGSPFHFKIGFAQYYPVFPVGQGDAGLGEYVAKIWRGSEPGWQNYFGPPSPIPHSNYYYSALVRPDFRVNSFVPLHVNSITFGYGSISYNPTLAVWVVDPTLTMATQTGPWTLT